VPGSEPNSYKELVGEIAGLQELLERKTAELWEVGQPARPPSGVKVSAGALCAEGSRGAESVSLGIDVRVVDVAGMIRS
jgi:hypothetical protein